MSKSMNDEPLIKLSDCWAKTDPATGEPALSVEDHCRIVGHVANVLWENLPKAVKAALPEGAVALTAAHDLGKLTPGFQLKCDPWKHYKALSAVIHHNGLETNHAHVSAWHLAYAGSQPMQQSALRWLVSTTGHHGSYPSGFEKPSRKCFEGVEPTGIHPQFERLRDELLSNLIQTFGGLPEEPAKEQEIRAHLLTGFTIFADWIGSNPDWFPPDQTHDQEDIDRKTREILTQFGMPLHVRPQLSFGQLFNPANPSAFPPRPLQQTLLKAADRPGLYIVEAPMGAGKTEAALVAAYQRWTTGEERGLYFALPTQLTSAKIHERIHSFLSVILDSPSYQSLVHGNAWLDSNRNRAVGPSTEEHSDTDEALKWFSTTRRQLLAPYGTGTIDQALLAILPARFAALRHFALAGKVVVIDEVHAYDPYMSALIDRLITFLLPTTVIILSATLTAARRAELVAAASATEESAPASYPLITKVATGDTTASHFEVPYRTPEKNVEIRHQTPENFETYWQSIASRVVAGANVVVIRNTVALAQQTFLHLKLDTARALRTTSFPFHPSSPTGKRRPLDRPSREKSRKTPHRLLARRHPDRRAIRGY
jgi:CRISPR-associated endonuclease/helicase Cas3